MANIRVAIQLVADSAKSWENLWVLPTSPRPIVSETKPTANAMAITVEFVEEKVERLILREHILADAVALHKESVRCHTAWCGEHLLALTELECLVKKVDLVLAKVDAATKAELTALRDSYQSKFVADHGVRPVIDSMETCIKQALVNRENEKPLQPTRAEVLGDIYGVARRQFVNNTKASLKAEFEKAFGLVDVSFAPLAKAEESQKDLMPFVKKVDFSKKKKA